MANIIATVWDFDKTLIKGYMQDPLFEDYGVDGRKFWEENNNRIAELKASGLSVNDDTFYLNQILKYVRNGKFKGLNNKKLLSYGTKQQFYDGVEDLFRCISQLSTSVSAYHEEGIVFENYIISSGLKKIIEGTSLKQYVKTVWGCEFSEAINEVSGKLELSDIAYSIDNTTKTRALFEINKGVNIPDLNIDVNTAIPQEQRRVQFINMVYIADGPSDIPAFSVVNKNKGATFAVYPKGNLEAMQQVDKMRKDGRIQMYAEADYQEGSMARMWILEKLNSQARLIIDNNHKSYQQYGKGTPQHLLN